MNIATIYQHQHVNLTIEPTANTKNALTNATLLPRERQLLLLLDKKDLLSELAVAALINKVDIEKLVSQGFLVFQTSVTTTEVKPSTVPQTPNLRPNLRTATSEAQVESQQLKQRLKSSKLNSFLSTYKASNAVEAENCSFAKCQVCGKDEECSPQVIDMYQQAEMTGMLIEEELVLNPEFEAIMIVQTLINVA